MKRLVCFLVAGFLASSCIKSTFKIEGEAGDEESFSEGCEISDWARPLYDSVYSDCDALEFIINKVPPNYANIVASAVAEGKYSVERLISDFSSGLDEEELVEKMNYFKDGK